MQQRAIPEMIIIARKPADSQRSFSMY